MDGCTNVQHGKGVCRPHYMKCWRGQLEWPEYTRPPEPTAEQRFWQKVDKRQPDECWPWMASMLRNGYGQFDHTTAHRFAMMASGFDVGSDEVVDHLCRNRACVNPAHLEIVPQAVNVARGYGPNLAATARRDEARVRTHCKRGHAMTPENTYTAPSHPTWRVCRACRRARKLSDAPRQNSGVV